MTCLAEIALASGVKSTFHPRTEFLNSSTSEKLNILGPVAVKELNSIESLFEKFAPGKRIGRSSAAESLELIGLSVRQVCFETKPSQHRLPDFDSDFFRG